LSMPARAYITSGYLVMYPERSATGKVCPGRHGQPFVSNYQLELPKKEDIERFLAQQIKEAGTGA